MAGTQNRNYFLSRRISYLLEGVRRNKKKKRKKKEKHVIVPCS